MAPGGRVSAALLVGAGTMGGRHLQGLAKSRVFDAILVVEPNPEARGKAGALWREVPEGQGKTLRFLDWPELAAEPPPAFALVATTAAGRLAILERLLELGIRHLLIEKIAFQCISDYRRAVRAAATASAQVRVNLPMRMVPLFQALRQRLAGQAFAMTVENGDRGLGCNGLHFFDLFSFIAGSEIDRMEVAIDLPPRPSPRGGSLIDFTGRAALKARSAARCDVRFTAGSNRLPAISITAADFSLTADFAGDKVSASDPRLLDAAFFMPMASRIAHQQAEQILAGTSLLPELADGFALNRLMLDRYNLALAGKAADDLVCPIT